MVEKLGIPAGVESSVERFQATKAVSDSLRTTFGPKGLDKMLVASSGNVTITNDGATIVREMEVDDPVADTVIDVAKKQEEVAGDGTTTVLLLVGALLEEAEQLLDDGHHPSNIIRGYIHAIKKTQIILEKICEPVDVDVDRHLLLEVAKTAISGKNVNVESELLAGLVVDAVQHIVTEDTLDLRLINIVAKSGSQLANSKFVNGLVLEQDNEWPSDPLPSGVDDASILVIENGIDSLHADIDENIVDRTPESTLSRAITTKSVESTIERILGFEIDILVCKETVDESVAAKLKQNGVIVLDNVGEETLETFSTHLGCELFSDIRYSDRPSLAQADVEFDKSNQLITLRNTSGTTSACSLLLHGSTPQITDEVHRNIEDSIDSVAQVVKDNRVLPGGGASEVEIARELREYSRTVSSREQIYIESFAEGLESVPKALARNMGSDPITVLANLRKAHYEGHIHAGIGSSTETVQDALENGILDPYIVKRQSLVMATETVCMVLKIDGSLKMENVEQGESSNSTQPM